LTESEWELIERAAVLKETIRASKSIKGFEVLKLRAEAKLRVVEAEIARLKGRES
jgi:hypothetical protein